MNLRSDANREAGAQVLPPGGVTPYEFRLLSGEDAQTGGCGSMGRGPEDGEERSAAVDPVRIRQEGYEQGEREGRRLARAEMEAEMRAAITQERDCVLSAVGEFRGMRQRYFVDVEQEVVKLALAIAARVLHREVQMDPLLLEGVVRVALEKMADRSGVVLKVSPADVVGWERVFHATEELLRPRVAEDAGLERGECVLETKMGKVELGVTVQLEEIEKGFFDLLNHRPVA